MKSSLTLLARLGLAAASGLAAYASYEPLGWWIAGILGVAGLYIALMPWSANGKGKAVSGKPVSSKAASLSKRAGALIAFVHALVCYLFLLPWIGEFVGRMPYIALAVFCALYAILLGVGGVAIARWRYGFIAFPFLYVAVEYLRSSFPFGGFSWVRLAWGQINGPLANLAPWGGPALVTFAAALAACGLAALIVRGPRIAGALTLVVTVGLGLLSGLGVGREEPTTGTVTMAAIQGNVPRMGLDFNAQRRAVLSNHARETHKVADEGSHPDLVIWPENSSDVNPFADQQARTLIDDAVAAVGAPIMVGTITRDHVGDRNTMVVFDPESGPGDHHYKRFLQPFGEYMPMRKFFRLFSSYVDMAGDFKPGHGTSTVKMRDVVVGIATCYEVAFDPAYRDAVNNGAQILTTPTNNATFGFTDMTYQQLAMSRMRAIELDRAVVVAATSGVSAMVNPDGTVSQQTKIFTPDHLVQEMPLRNSITFAARYGHLEQAGLIIVGIVVAVSALVTTRRGAARTPARAKKS